MSSTPTPSTTSRTSTAASPPAPLVEHWVAQVDTYTTRKNDADKAKKTADEALADAKKALDAEDKLLTDLTKQVADTRAALAKADLVEVEALSKQLFALIVRQHDSEGQRLQRARKLDVAQADADVAADRVSDAAAGLNEAKGKLTAAEAAQKKREELIASREKAPYKDALARASSDATKELLAKATARISVVPDSLRGPAKTRFDREMAALEDAIQAAKDAEKAEAEEDASGRIDAVVAVRRGAFSEAESELRTWLESADADVTQAIAALARVAGNKDDPPLLSDKERERIKGAPAGAAVVPTAAASSTVSTEPKEGAAQYDQAAPDAAAGVKAAARQAAPGYETPPAADAAGSPKAPPAGAVTAEKLIALGRAAVDSGRAYRALVAQKKADKPGLDPDSDPAVKQARQAWDAAVKAYEEAVKHFVPRPSDYVPDKVWQAVLDVWIAERSLNRVTDAEAANHLKRDLDSAERSLVTALGKAADHRREAEDLKYAARRAAKLLESVRADHPARLLSAVRGDF